MELQCSERVRLMLVTFARGVSSFCLRHLMLDVLLFHHCWVSNVHNGVCIIKHNLFVLSVFSSV